MHEIQRHQIILGEVAGRPVVTVAELVGLTGASEATIRRDITALHAEGRLRRVRGGAERLDAVPWQTRLQTPAFEATRRQNLPAKRAIARAAAALLADGESIIVNGGTTTYCLGPHIAHRGLQVLTNSLDLALYLLGNGSCRVVLPGGDIHREQRMVVSPYAADTVIEHFYAAKFFLGAHAIRRQGLIEGDPILIKAEQKMLKQAESVIALVDGSKFQPRGSLILCDLARLDRVVTDDSAPEEACDMLREAGIAVDVVEVGNEDRLPDRGMATL